MKKRLVLAASLRVVDLDLDSESRRAPLLRVSEAALQSQREALQLYSAEEEGDLFANTISELLKGIHGVCEERGKRPDDRESAFCIDKRLKSLSVLASKLDQDGLLLKEQIAELHEFYIHLELFELKEHGLDLLHGLCYIGEEWNRLLQDYDYSIFRMSSATKMESFVGCLKIIRNLVWSCTLQMSMTTESETLVVELRVLLSSFLVEEEEKLFEMWLINLPSGLESLHRGLNDDELFRSARSKLTDGTKLSLTSESTQLAGHSASFRDLGCLTTLDNEQFADVSRLRQKADVDRVGALQSALERQASDAASRASLNQSSVLRQRQQDLLEMRRNLSRLTNNESGGTSRGATNAANEVQEQETKASSSFVDSFESQFANSTMKQLCESSFAEPFSAFAEERGDKRRGVYQMVDSLLATTIEDFSIVVSICQLLSHRTTDLNVIELRYLTEGVIDSPRVKRLLRNGEFEAAKLGCFRIQGFLILHQWLRLACPLRVVDIEICDTRSDDGNCTLRLFQIASSVQIIYDAIQSDQFDDGLTAIETLSAKVHEFYTKVSTFQPSEQVLNRLNQLVEFVSALKQDCILKIAKRDLVCAFQTSLVRITSCGFLPYNDSVNVQWVNPKSVKKAALLEECSKLESALGLEQGHLAETMRARANVILRLRQSVLKTMSTDKGIEDSESIDDIFRDWVTTGGHPFFGSGSQEMRLVWEMGLRNRFIDFLLADTPPTVTQILQEAYGFNHGVDKEDRTTHVIKYASALLDLSQCLVDQRLLAVDHVPRYDQPLLTLPSLEEQFRAKLADLEKNRLSTLVLLGNAHGVQPPPSSKLRDPNLVTLKSLLAQLHNSNTASDLYCFHSSSVFEEAQELLEGFRTFFESPAVLEIHSNVVEMKMAKLVSIAAMARRKLIAQHLESARTSQVQFSNASDFLKAAGMAVDGPREDLLNARVGDLQSPIVNSQSASETATNDRFCFLGPNSRRGNLDAAAIRYLQSDGLYSSNCKSTLASVTHHHSSSDTFIRLRAWEEKIKSAALQNAIVADLEAPFSLLQCTSRAETSIVFGLAYRRLENLSKEMATTPFIIDGLTDAVAWALCVRLAIASENWTRMPNLQDQFSQQHFANLRLPGLKHQLDIALSIMKHSAIVDKLVAQFWPIETETVFYDDKSGFFSFIDFRQLFEAVSASQVLDLQTAEVVHLRQVGSSLIQLKEAIDMGSWENRPGQEGVPSVRSILLSIPENCPRRVAAELEKIKQELQNVSVEMRLVEVVTSGRSYLAGGDLFGHENVETDDLERVVESASRLRHRNPVNASLFEMASRILNLRRAVKSGDWTSLRYFLTGPLPSLAITTPSLLGTASDAVFEIEALQSMSKKNHQMHHMLGKAMSQHAVAGDAMRLQTQNVSVTNLLMALRAASGAPKISIEDDKLLLSAEKLKNLRICFLMCDYSKLIEEVASINLGMIHESCIEEVYITKKAVDANYGLNRVRGAIAEGKPVGVPGNVAFQTARTTELDGALAIFESSSSNVVASQFLESARSILLLRIAARIGRWCVRDISDVLLTTVAGSTHEAFKVVDWDYTKEIFGGITQERSASSRVEPSHPNVAYNKLFSDTNKAEYGIEGFDPNEIEYNDIPGSAIFLSASLSAAKNDPHSVPSLLLSVARSGVLVDFESEALLIRDELYHKVAVYVLRSCLSGGSSGVEVADAVRVVRHLGVKSKEVGRLLYSAFFMRALRESYKKGDLRRTIALLGRVGRLKSSGSLSSVAAKEIEAVYEAISGDNITAELTEALASEGPDAESLLGRALSHSSSVSTQSEAIERLSSLCGASLELRKAIRSGVTFRVNQALVKTNQVLARLSSSPSPLHLDAVDKLFGLIRRAQEVGNSPSQTEIGHVKQSPAPSAFPVVWKEAVESALGLIRVATGKVAVVDTRGSLVRSLEIIVGSSSDGVDQVTLILSYVILGTVVDSQSTKVSVSALNILADVYPETSPALDPVRHYAFHAREVHSPEKLIRLGKALRRAIPVLLDTRAKRLFVRDKVEKMAESAVKKVTLSVLELKHGLHAL